MPYLPVVSRLAMLATVLGTSAALLSLPTLANAQPGLGGPGAGNPAGPGQPGQRQEKKDGPAEEAPKDKEALRPIEPVPAQPKRRRRIQLFDLHGYMRMRGDYFHRLDLDLAPASELDDGETPTKFFPPPAETTETDEDGEVRSPAANDANCFARLTSGGVSDSRATDRCRRRKGAASANIRLRLEPTLRLSDTVSVHSQIDVLDNLVLGSTPDGEVLPGAPLDLYTRTQLPPESSITAKQAWGHMRFGWGLDVRFGRMPWSWGMGMLANHGNGYFRGEQADIIRHLDRDYGDSVDSVRLAFTFGKDRRKAHTVAASWDWAASGPTTAQLLGPAYGSQGTIGQAFSIEKFDNLYQWSLSLERRDDPQMLKRKLSLGTPVVNYGIIAWLRYQDVDNAYLTNPLSDPTTPESDNDRLQNYANTLVQRQAIIAMPDFWLRVNWRTLRIELEVAGSFGTFRLREDYDDDDEAALEDYNTAATLTRSGLERRTIANAGYALEFKYGFFQDRFHIGLDQGFAMGDTAGTDSQFAEDPLRPNDNRRLSAFRFNPAYNIDLILFRELLGTVSNAAYFKPWAAFYFFDHFSARVDVEYALAARRQSTLGNRFSYGIELDGAFRYHDVREPIFFQLQYGVMFPLGAFNRQRAIGREDARAVQTVQGQLGIRF